MSRVLTLGFCTGNVKRSCPFSMSFVSSLAGQLQQWASSRSSLPAYPQPVVLCILHCPPPFFGVGHPLFDYSNSVSCLCACWRRFSLLCSLEYRLPYHVTGRFRISSHGPLPVMIRDPRNSTVSSKILEEMSHAE